MVLNGICPDERQLFLFQTKAPPPAKLCIQKVGSTQREQLLKVLTKGPYG